MSHPLPGEPLPPARDDDVAALALDPAQVLPPQGRGLGGCRSEASFLTEVTGRHASYGETWTGVEMALRAGVRGLPGGSSLARLRRGCDP